MNQPTQKGIALLMAMVTVSALLLIVVAISDISYKEQLIAYAGRDSKIAYYAANTGAECALFFDLKGGGTAFDGEFRFAVSENSPISTETEPFNCNGNPTRPFTDAGSGGATTTFFFNITDNNNESCSIVRVAKTLVGLDIKTKIEARGYNVTCVEVAEGQETNTPALSEQSLRNLERSLRIYY